MLAFNIPKKVLLSRGKRTDIILPMSFWSPAKGGTIESFKRCYRLLRSLQHDKLGEKIIYRRYNKKNRTRS